MSSADTENCSGGSTCTKPCLDHFYELNFLATIRELLNN